jgi:predicted dehydrogenase
MILNDRLGRIVSIEGRLWQASRVAHYSPSPVTFTKREWTGDKTLAGAYGVSLGLGTHWLDAMQFLAGDEPLALQHYAVRQLHDGSGGDDVYVRLNLQGSDGALVSGSVANMMHGARNDFEIVVMGEKASAQWTLMNPDEIMFGKGRERSILYRKDTAHGSNQPPFHGVGWLEGYIEILRQSYRDMLGMPHTPYPTLAESNQAMDILLKRTMEW